MRFYTILFLHLSLLLAFSANAQEIDEILEREEESLDVADENVKNLNVKDFSSLEKLVPFDDIAVIQKRYLPRTKRFEFFPNVGMILNDAFFTNYIFGGKFAYHFSEKWGLEATYLALSQSEKQVVDDLDSEGVETTSILTPESYMGIDLKWVPIYGKMAWMNQEIIPFDFYFTFGLAITNDDPHPEKKFSLYLHKKPGQEFLFHCKLWNKDMCFMLNTNKVIEDDNGLQNTGWDSKDSFNLDPNLHFFTEAKMDDLLQKNVSGGTKLYNVDDETNPDESPKTVVTFLDIPETIPFN